jgi:hypothetical protein
MEMMDRYLDFLGFETTPLVANFSADHYSTCQNLPVIFRANCAGKPESYHWFFEGGTPSESFDPMVSVQWPVAGSYNVSLTIADAETTNTMSRDSLIVINDCNGNDEFLKNLLLKIYPNPVTNGHLKLEVNSPESMKTRLHISDMMGRTFRATDVHIIVGINKFDIDLEGVRPGVYVLSLQNKIYCISSRIIIR